MENVRELSGLFAAKHMACHTSKAYQYGYSSVESVSSYVIDYDTM